MINHIVESIYPDCGQKDTTVVLFQEKNLRELNAMFLRVVVKPGFSRGVGEGC